MTLRRLRDQNITELERELLDSALDDAPSHAARARTLAALGLGAGAGVLASAHGVAHAAGKAASGAVAGGGAGVVTAKSTVLSLVVAKWLGAGALVGALVTGVGAALTLPAPEPPSPEQIIRAASPARAERTVSPIPHATVTSTELGPVDELPGAVPELGVPQGRGDTSGPPFEKEWTGSSGTGSSAANVAEEVASLDAARGALAAGDARGALGLLSTHEALFPAGTLAPEAVLLRARALMQLGDRRAASVFVERFLASHPTSPQALRMRAVVRGARSAE